MLIKNRYYANLPVEITKIVLNFEGGYQKDKVDDANYYKGVLVGTKYGITPGALQAAMNTGVIDTFDITPKSMENLDVNIATKIYEVRYYIPIRGHQLQTPLNLLVFDTSILHGRGGAGTILQKTIKKYDYSIIIDGDIGPRTISSTNKMISVLGIEKVCRDFIKFRESSYIEIVKKSPKKEKFLKGWMNRLSILTKKVEEILGQKVDSNGL